MIQFEVSGRVAVIRLDRPEARNAINSDLTRAIEDSIDRLERDDDLWVGILSHTGPVFCAGADLKEIAAGRGAALATERGSFAGIVMRERTKPLIAAVNGPAVAGGAEIVLACDLCVASTAARFGLPEVKRSLVASAGALFRLPRVLPRPIAMEMVLTGDTIDVSTAHHHGLVNAICEPGLHEEVARTLADRIVANAPSAVRETRRLLLDSYDQTDGEAMVAAADAQRRLAST